MKQPKLLFATVIASLALLPRNDTFIDLPHSHMRDEYLKMYSSSGA